MRGWVPIPVLGGLLHSWLLLWVVCTVASLPLCSSLPVFTPSPSLPPPLSLPPSLSSSLSLPPSLPQNSENLIATSLMYADVVWDRVALESDELSFRVGEVIEILDMTDDMWWQGSVRDRSGWFPSSFVRVSHRDQA